MARGTYISENLTQAQLDVLLQIDELEIDIFSLADIKKLSGDFTVNINEVIENLVHKKLLSRIERGKYCRINFRDEKVIGCFMVQDGAIGYWSALNHHGLTEQFPNTVFIQTTRSKTDKSVFGVTYQFVKVKASKRAGIQSLGYGNHQYRITDIEKTLVDCFDLPQYAGGYPELIRAFDQASPDQDKLIEYCSVIGNISAVKRIAFLTELLGKDKMTRFLKYAATEVNARYVLLDPFGNEAGTFNNKWKLRLNISEEEIQSIIHKNY